jgi:hypothetical protein
MAKKIGGNSIDHLTSKKNDGWRLHPWRLQFFWNIWRKNSKLKRNDYWVVKLDENRNIIWDKTYGEQV